MKLDRVIAVRNRKTVFRDGDRCIKMFSPDYSKADVLNEALNQSRIEETGICVPEILELVCQNGQWAIISRFVEGKTMQQLMAEPGADQKALMERFVNLQIGIHQHTCPLLNRQKDRMNMQIYQCNLDATLRYHLHSRLDMMPRQNLVCHGDFRPSNIIIQENGIPCILDWSHATQGNPAADAARTYLLFWLEGKITGAQNYLNLFCEKNSIPKTDVEKWMPIVAAARSIKGNEKEREFLLSWVRTADRQ